MMTVYFSLRRGATRFHRLSSGRDQYLIVPSYGLRRVETPTHCEFCG